MQPMYRARNGRRRWTFAHRGSETTAQHWRHSPMTQLNLRQESPTWPWRENQRPCCKDFCSGQFVVCETQHRSDERCDGWDRQIHCGWIGEWQDTRNRPSDNIWRTRWNQRVADQDCVFDHSTRNNNAMTLALGHLEHSSWDVGSVERHLECAGDFDTSHQRSARVRTGRWRHLNE